MSVKARALRTASGGRSPRGGRQVGCLATLALAACFCALPAGATGAVEYPPPPPVSGPISHGPKCFVPDLIGKTLPQVRQTFKSRHTWCRLGAISGKTHGTVVVKQSPKGGSHLPPGTRVNITLRSPRDQKRGR